MITVKDPEKRIGNSMTIFELKEVLLEKENWHSIKSITLRIAANSQLIVIDQRNYYSTLFQKFHDTKTANNKNRKPGIEIDMKEREKSKIIN